MRKSTGPGSTVASWAAAAVFAFTLAIQAAAAPADMTAAAKVAKLASLKAEYRQEVQANGFDTEKAKQLRTEIAELEKAKTVDGDAASAPASSPTAAPASTTDPAKDKNGGHVIDEIQSVQYSSGGVGNPCGPYAVTTLLRSFGHDDVNYQDVFDAIAPIKTGTSPHDIKRYFQKKGHGVSDRNNGSLDDLQAGIDRDERIMILCNVEGTLESLHWAAIKGYKIVNGERRWIFEDTAIKPKELTDAELSKMWKTPMPGLGVGAGYNNYYMTVSKDPPGIGERLLTTFYGLNNRTYAEVATSGLRDVTRGFADTFGGGRSVGDRVGGFAHLTGGVVKVAGALVGGLAQIPGNYLQAGGDSLMGWGAEKWRNGGFFGKIAGAGATVLGAITKGVGWILSGAGAIVSGIAGAIGDGISAVGDAIGDGIDAVGDFVGGLF